VDDVYDGGEEGDSDEDVDDDQNDGAVGCMPDDGTPAQAHGAQSHETKVEAVAIVHVSRPGHEGRSEKEINSDHDEAPKYGYSQWRPFFTQWDARRRFGSAPRDGPQLHHLMVRVSARAAPGLPSVPLMFECGQGPP